MTKMRGEIIDLIFAYERLIVLARLKEGTLTRAERDVVAFYAQELEQEMLSSGAIEYKLSA